MSAARPIISAAPTESTQTTEDATKTPAPCTSALERHIGFFSKNNYLTYDSMKSQLLALHSSEQDAASLANTVSFVGGLKIKWCPYRAFQPKEAVGVLNHSRDTGIYNDDGSINEERWEKLRTYGEIDNGTEVITEKRFYEFLKWCRDTDKRSDWTGLGKKASDGEWSTFFNMCTDYWKKSPEGEERAIKIATLRVFFENSPVVFDKVVKSELPVPRPGK